MWDAVRNLFRRDEQQSTTEQPANEALTDASPAANPALPGNAAREPAATAPEGEGAVALDETRRVEESAEDAPPPSPDNTSQVSPPGHAPQGLAAEPTGHPHDDVPVVNEANIVPAPEMITSEPATSEPELPIAPNEPEKTESTGASADHEAEATVDAAISTKPMPSQDNIPADTAETAAAAPDGLPAVAEPLPAVEVPQPAAAPQSVVEAEGTSPAATETAEAPTATEATTVEAPAATETAEAPAVGDTTEAPTATEITEEVAPVAPLTPYPADTVIGGRYTIVGLAEGVAPTDDTIVYRASDAQSYARCWSCGSTANGPTTRFCQNCGAPIQNHVVTLVETREPTGEDGEIEHEGAHFHVQPERRMFGAEGIGIEIGAYSAEGPHHPNEDSFWYITQTSCGNSRRQSSAIALLADGMGGYAPGSGLISSRIVATIGAHLLAGLQEASEGAQPLDDTGASQLMHESITAANKMVLEEIARTGEMGATFVGLIVSGDTAYIANIGDSRAYYIDPHGRATAITRDQSLVAQEVAQGRLSENDIYTAIGNNIILHAVGEDGVEDAADWYTQPLEPGSYLLLCSDGYWKTLHGAVMPDDVLHEAATLGEAARLMVDKALTEGSDDNTTVVLIAIS